MGDFFISCPIFKLSDILLINYQNGGFYLVNILSKFKALCQETDSGKRMLFGRVRNSKQKYTHTQCSATHFQLAMRIKQKS